MARVLKLRRGTTAQHSTFTGAEGEVTVDTTTDSLVVHDNVTVGGHRQASEAYVDAAIANVSGGTANTGNVSFSNVTISTSLANANLVLDPNGTGVVEAAANLHVTSNAMLLGSSDEVSIRYRAAGEGGSIWKRAQLSTAHNGNANIGVQILSNDTSYMFFNPLTGNIGINVTNPGETFDVNGNIRGTHVNVASDYDGGFRFYGADVIGLTGLFHINSNVQHTLSLVHNGQEYLSADVNGWVTSGNIQVYNNFNVGGEADLPGNTYVGLRTSFIAAQANLQYAGDQNDYLQFIMQNKSTGINASTDMIMTADNGTDSEGFIDIGINGSNYSDPDFSITSAGDGYVYVHGIPNVSGNLAIGTVHERDIVFHTGGTTAANEIARFRHGEGLVMHGNIIPAANVTYNLGEPGNEWNSLYVSSNTIYIGGVPLSVDNTGSLIVNGILGTTSDNDGYLRWQGNSSSDGNGYTTLGLIPDDTRVANDQYIIIDPTAPNHIHIRAGGPQDDSSAQLFVGGENSYFSVGAGVNPSLYIAANSSVWTFDGNGVLTIPSSGEGTEYTIGESEPGLVFTSTAGFGFVSNLNGDTQFITVNNQGVLYTTSNIQIKSAGIEVASDGNVYITSNVDNNASPTWTFANSGVTIIPGSLLSSTGSISFLANSTGDGNGYSTIEINPDINLNNDQYIVIDPTEPDHIHIRAGGTQDNSTAKLIIGGENSHFSVGAGNNPAVYAKANGAQWIFDIDGNLYFPDATVQSTAWTGSANINSVGTLTSLTVDNVYINDNIISTVNTNQDLTIDPNGTGRTILSGNVTVTGNLTVEGITYTVGSENYSVQDSIIDLHTLANLAPWTTDDGRDIGIRMHYFKSVSDKHAALVWKNSNQRLTYYSEATETNGVISGTVGNIQISDVFASNITLTGTGTSISASQGNILTNQITGTQINFLSGIYTVGLNASGASSTYTLNLPANAGVNGQVLTTNGSGSLSWSNLPSSYTFYVAGDDSTLRQIGNGETLRFEGAGGTTVTTDAEGKITITGSAGGGTVLEEPFESKTTATGVVTHDATTNRLFYHTSISANFTANFTNLGLAANEATSVSLVLVQGATARMCNAVQISGAAQTIVWQGSAVAPLGNANRTDVVTFSILCTATDTYTVLGMLTSFGG